MDRYSTGELRKNLADLLNRVKYNKERIRVHRRDKDVAALVSIEDLEVIEELEDRIDINETEEALAEYNRTGEWVSVREYARQRGLTR